MNQEEERKTNFEKLIDVLNPTEETFLDACRATRTEFDKLRARESNVVVTAGDNIRIMYEQMLQKLEAINESTKDL